jgi:hypothetical protein
MAMVRKQFYITAEQDRYIKELANSLSVTEAEVIRRAISQVLRAERPLDSGELVEYKLRSDVPANRVRDVRVMDRSLSYELSWSRADMYRDHLRHLDDSAWEEELAFIEQRMRAMPEGGSTAKWSREDSYDKRRTRLPD